MSDASMVWVSQRAKFQRPPTIFHLICPWGHSRLTERVDREGNRWTGREHLTLCGYVYGGWEQTGEWPTGRHRSLETGLMLRRDHAESFANLCRHCARADV